MTAGDAVIVRRFPWAAERNAGLICFPHPTQPAHAFAAFADLLSPSVAVVAIQCFTWMNRPAVDRVERTVMPAVFDVVDDWADCPLVLFGHRAGAWLAFEVARRLERVSHVQLAGLFASASPAPSRWWRGDTPAPSGFDEPHDEPVMGDISRYGTQDMVQCSITVLVGDADPRSTINDASAWSEHTTRAFDLRIFPDDDRYFDAYQRDIANAISDHLLSVRGEDGQYS